MLNIRNAGIVSSSIQKYPEIYNYRIPIHRCVYSMIRNGCPTSHESSLYLIPRKSKTLEWYRPIKISKFIFNLKRVYVE